MSDWKSQKESAEYIGVTDRTIRNYIASGVLPARRIKGSRLIRISVNDLNALLCEVPTVGRGDAA